MEQIGFGQWLKDSARQPDFFFFDRDRETHSAGDSETQTQLRFGHARFWL